MATAEKIAIVEEYAQKFKEAKSVFLADFSGMDVATANDLRGKFRQADVEYKVLKNRLAKRSLNQAGIDALDEHLKGVTSFVIGYDDPVAPAKIIKDFNGKTEKLKLKVVYFEGKVLDTKQAAQLADLPSREQLLSQFIGMLQTPMTKFAGTLQATMQKMVGVLNSLKEQKQ